MIQFWPPIGAIFAERFVAGKSWPHRDVQRRGSVGGSGRGELAPLRYEPQRRTPASRGGRRLEFQCGPATNALLGPRGHPQTAHPHHGRSHGVAGRGNWRATAKVHSDNIHRLYSDHHSASSTKRHGLQPVTKIIKKNINNPKIRNQTEKNEQRMYMFKNDIKHNKSKDYQ